MVPCKDDPCFKLRRKILRMKGKVVTRRQIDFSCSSKARFPTDYIYDTMKQMEQEGYGKYINHEFYKRPDIPEDMLAKYTITKTEYNVMFNELPASGAPFSANTRSEQLSLHFSIYGGKGVDGMTTSTPNNFAPDRSSPLEPVAPDPSKFDPKDAGSNETEADHTD